MVMVPRGEMVGRSGVAEGLSVAVNEKTTGVSVPERAVIWTGPAVAPSVTVMEASPSVPVLTEAALRVAVPVVTLKAIAWAGAGALVVLRAAAVRACGNS